MTRENLEEASSFSAVLRERTKDVHREAERTGFIAELIRGRATRAGYGLFLCNLVPAYAALEAGLDRHGGTPVIAAFADPALRRLPALQRDLGALIGSDWWALPTLPAANAYAAEIAASAEGDGLGLVAHAYARYLGDLSGGQILKPLLARNLGLGPEALAFYNFPDIADPAAAKAAMRQALDQIAPDGVGADEILAEAISAFRHNIAVSQAVQAALA